MIMTVENGYQAVLMAPTEVLARQHFQAMEKLLQEQNIDFGHPVLLTMSLTEPAATISPPWTPAPGLKE